MVTQQVQPIVRKESWFGPRCVNEQGTRRSSHETTTEWSAGVRPERTGNSSAPTLAHDKEIRYRIGHPH
jgi:hypothetical protein